MDYYKLFRNDTDDIIIDDLIDFIINELNRPENNHIPISILDFNKLKNSDNCNDKKSFIIVILNKNRNLKKKIFSNIISNNKSFKLKRFDQKIKEICDDYILTFKKVDVFLNDINNAYNLCNTIN
jgi:hypothetical protein